MELLELEESFVEAHVAWLDALDRQADADRRYCLLRPVLLQEVCSSATQTNADHAMNRRRADAAARRVAGVRPAERAVEAAEVQVGRVITTILRKRAETLAGMECKLRILRIRPYTGVMASVEADLRALALLPLRDQPRRTDGKRR
jgi:hypothetical protein